MASSPILLVDIMDTVVHDPFREELLDFFDTDLESLLEQKHPTAWEEFERHEIDEATFYGKFFEGDRTLDGDELRRVLEGAYRFVDGMEQLLADLDEAGYEMHALSNYPVWYRLIEQKLELSQFLNWTFVSWKTGYRKPDAGAYEHAVRTLGAEASDCLFIDNRPENCRSAREFGLRALHFEDAERLRDDLREALPEPTL